MKSAAATAWKFAQQQPSREKLRVLFAGHQFPAGYHYTQLEIAKRGATLANKIQLVQAPTRDDLLRIVTSASSGGGEGIHVALPFMERFDATFLQQAADTSLLMIQQFGVGLEGVDIDVATRLGVAVCNVPARNCYNAQATAEHALLLTLMLLRGTHNTLPRQFAQRQLGGGWTPPVMPQTLFRQRVTVVGFGAVGSTLCRYLTVLGAHVTAVRRSWDNDTYNNNNDNNNQECYYNVKQSTNLDKELPTTDILILCCTLNQETHHLMNEHRLNVLLPKGALVVNVGRGPLVEYQAIYKAVVVNEHVAGFASDVGVGGGVGAIIGRNNDGGEQQPKPAEPWDPHDELSKHDNTIFTPHVGGNCHVVVQSMAKIIVDNLERILHGQAPHHWVNQQEQEEELIIPSMPVPPPSPPTF